MSENKRKLVELLGSSTDIFAWSRQDMPGISHAIISHKLNIKLIILTNHTGKRTFNAERYQAIGEEVEKLIKASFIREVQYPDWLSNIVLVKKANKKWRMCVDFTDLNEAYPKDNFPLFKIDQLVDSTAGYAFLSFMDAYSGYNQIKICAPNQTKTTFITDRGLYYYKVRPFVLKNVEATYQRLVNKMFRKHICKTIEVYVDDMLVKNKQETDHVEDLKEMFGIPQEYMKLNPDKCAFSVEKGKFLGFMVDSSIMRDSGRSVKNTESA